MSKCEWEEINNLVVGTGERDWISMAVKDETIHIAK
jgi:hypothetical protein